ncbi:hypothetical protein LXL04_029614 [Taraxacum kok-saghyz]
MGFLFSQTNPLQETYLLSSVIAFYPFPLVSYIDHWTTQTHFNNKASFSYEDSEFLYLRTVLQLKIKKMDENQNFEQIWGFRKNVDSSSDDSKSNSNTNHTQEKLDLVPNLVSPEIDRVSETVQLEKKPKRARNTPKKEKKTKKEVKSKSKKDSCASSNIKKKGNNTRTKKSKFLSQMTVSDDFRIFTESILDDLRIARETMFEKMRKEMDEIMKSKPSSRSRKKTGNANNQTKNQNQNQNQNQKPRSRKRKTAQEKTKKDLDHPQEHVNNEETKEPISKNPILIDSCGKKPIFTNTQDHIITSSYLTLPLVLPNPRSNETNLKLERGNYSGLQVEERFHSFGNNNNESSCVGNGYPIGLNNYQRFNSLNSFGIPNRVSQGFSDDGNLLGTRMMNGGMRYAAGLGGHTIPNHLTSNGIPVGKIKISQTSRSTVAFHLHAAFSRVASPTPNDAAFPRGGVPRGFLRCRAATEASSTTSKPNSDSECTPSPHRCKSPTSGRTTAAPTPVRTTPAPQQVAPPLHRRSHHRSAPLNFKQFGLFRVWWRLNSVKFPILSEVAKLVLAMPISTVASESAFSTGGRVIDATRSSLTHVTAEALICTQDWIRNTPIDIQFKQISAAILEEQRERLAKIELDTLGNSEECGLDDIDD